MDAAEILNQLTHEKGLPKTALQAASEQRAEIVPVFLREIDSYLALTPAERAEPTPLFFIFHFSGIGERRPRTGRWHACCDVHATRSMTFLETRSR
jgi:hypothetical protein